MRHPERIPFRAVALVFAMGTIKDATHLFMALFRAKTLKTRIAAAKMSPLKTAKCTPPHLHAKHYGVGKAQTTYAQQEHL